MSSVCSSLLSHDEAVTILRALCGAVIETANKNVCTRALWCLAKQTLPVEAVEAEVCTPVTACLSNPWWFSGTQVKVVTFRAKENKFVHVF